MAIVINVLVWIFVLFSLFNGRNIEKEVNNEKRYVAIIIFLLLSILLFIKLRSIITLASIIIAGTIYSVIPTGYNNEGIYIKGKKYAYAKMKSADMNEERNCYRLTFVYRGRPYFISVKKEDRYILEDVIARYRRSQIL